MTKEPDPNPASAKEKAEGDRNHVAPDAGKAIEQAVDEAQPRRPEQNRPEDRDRQA